MGLTAALIGGFSGFGMQMMTNATRKVPMSRQPWMHVAYFCVGCWAGNKYVAVEKSLVKDINEIRADKGMAPMVGTGAYIKYAPAE
mmetsp:Transcript_10678/g.14975  ORF Transcript_10678/g.14975 Transcript_10678/m.14975 type:complete len:86 (-) Transcript_10678:218-475(-)